MSEGEDQPKLEEMVSPSITVMTDAEESSKIPDPVSNSSIIPEVLAPEVAVVAPEVIVPDVAVVAPEVLAPDVAAVAPEVLAPDVAVEAPLLNLSKQEGFLDSAPSDLYEKDGGWVLEKLQTYSFRPKQANGFSTGRPGGLLKGTGATGAGAPSDFYEKDGGWVLEKIPTHLFRPNQTKDFSKGQPASLEVTEVASDLHEKDGEGSTNSFLGPGQSASLKETQAAGSILYEKDGKWLLEKIPVYRIGKGGENQPSSLEIKSIKNNLEEQEDVQSIQETVGNGNVISGPCGCAPADPVKAVIDTWLGVDSVPCNLCDPPKERENDLIPLWNWMYTLVTEVTSMAKEFKRTMGQKDASCGGGGSSDIPSNSGIETILVSSKATQSTAVIQSDRSMTKNWKL